MRGYVETPQELAYYMADKLFTGNPPEEGDRILYPGCGRGPFIEAVHRYCEENTFPIPDGVGIELNPDHLASAKEKHADKPVIFREMDFLKDRGGLDGFEYIIGNPPYVSIERLGEEEKYRFRKNFETAVGRFDFYVLFFERALNLLRDGGRLCFVTPEKFEYTKSTAALREMLSRYHVEEIEHIDENSFGELVTYPVVTTVHNSTPGETKIILRDGEDRHTELPADGESWASKIRGGEPDIDTGVVLSDVCERISCGVATGADSVFVTDEDKVPAQLENWTFPTTSGKQLRINDGPESGKVFICPYDDEGNLASEENLGAFGKWAELHEKRLKDRSCYERGRRPWYAWHENPPMQDILQPKLLCKDVTEEPHFWVDEDGNIVPRHSVYYIVPESGMPLAELQSYLNSSEAQAWLEANCQRAANGFLRLQSEVLKRLPVPRRFARYHQSTLQVHGNQ